MKVQPANMGVHWLQLIHTKNLYTNFVQFLHKLVLYELIQTLFIYPLYIAVISKTQWQVLT